MVIMAAGNVEISKAYTWPHLLTASQSQTCNGPKLREVTAHLLLVEPVRDVSNVYDPRRHLVALFLFLLLLPPPSLLRMRTGCSCTSGGNVTAAGYSHQPDQIYGQTHSLKASAMTRVG